MALLIWRYAIRENKGAFYIDFRKTICSKERRVWYYSLLMTVDTSAQALELL